MNTWHSPLMDLKIRGIWEDITEMYFKCLTDTGVNKIKKI